MAAGWPFLAPLAKNKYTDPREKDGFGVCFVFGTVFYGLVIVAVRDAKRCRKAHEDKVSVNLFGLSCICVVSWRVQRCGNLPNSSSATTYPEHNSSAVEQSTKGTFGVI